MEELKGCLEAKDFRTALYCCKDIAEDDSVESNPYGQLALGIALSSSEAYPECISVIENALAVNDKAEMNQNCRFISNRILAAAYYQVGMHSKARECLVKARQYAQNSQDLRQVDFVEKMLEGQ